MPLALASLAARPSMNLVIDERSSPAIRSMTSLKPGSTRIWITTLPLRSCVDKCSTSLSVLPSAVHSNRTANVSATAALFAQGAF